MQKSTHRRPGYPMRPIDQSQLEKWDIENVEKFNIETDAAATSLTPTSEDSKQLGAKRDSPME